MVDLVRDIQSEVKEYYGERLESKADLQTNACCLAEEGLTPKQADVLSKVHEEVQAKFYGCGSPIPPVVEGATILDLGSGSGTDVYMASGLVGEKGRVIGVDMTEAQVEVAKKHQEYHR